jgi:hypothetical protein
LILQPGLGFYNPRDILRGVLNDGPHFAQILFGGLPIHPGLRHLDLLALRTFNLEAAHNHLFPRGVLFRLLVGIRSVLLSLLALSATYQDYHTKNSGGERYHQPLEGSWRIHGHALLSPQRILSPRLLFFNLNAGDGDGL